MVTMIDPIVADQEELEFLGLKPDYCTPVVQKKYRPIEDILDQVMACQNADVVARLQHEPTSPRKRPTCSSTTPSVSCTSRPRTPVPGARPSRWTRAGTSSSCSRGTTPSSVRTASVGSSTTTPSAWAIRKTAARKPATPSWRLGSSSANCRRTGISTARISSEMPRQNSASTTVATVAATIVLESSEEATELLRGNLFKRIDCPFTL